MDKAILKTLAKKRRHKRVRKHIFGSSIRPRLNIYKSNIGIYAQIIDDENAVTITAASTIDKELKGKIKIGSNREAAAKVGELIAKRALAKKLEKVIFDRGSSLYHGRVKALAAAAREAGLKF